jgi:AcrR family transcriptional regulator
MARTRSRRRNEAAGPGRPRSASVDHAILRAALALFIEHGPAGASIERIARRAGVAKTSIYRRWPSRDALLAQAIETGRNESAPGLTAAAVERASPADFLDLVLGAGGVMARRELRALMARLIGSVPDHPRLLEIYRDTYVAPRRQALVGALRRLQAAGALAADADVETVADMLGGAVIHRILLAPEPGDNPETLRRYLVGLLRAAGIDLAALDALAG